MDWVGLIVESELKLNKQQCIFLTYRTERERVRHTEEVRRREREIERGSERERCVEGE